MDPPPLGTPPRPYRIDVSNPPLLSVEFVGTTTDVEFDDYLREMDVLMARLTPHAVVIDMRAATRLAPAQRAKMTAWLKSNDLDVRKWVSSHAFVISNPLVRGSLTAIFWISPPAAPTLVTGDLGEARRWSLARFAERFG